MTKEINGVVFESNGDFAICHVESLSTELKTLIKNNLTSICHGSHIFDYADEPPLFGYEATLASFLDRYKSKPLNTKKGMVGEFLAHILIAELFDDFDIATAFFNLEEKSIKKGFDLLLYKSLDKSVWITEVKSGNLLKDKTHDQTTSALLHTAKADLDKRLNAQETMYWYNAVNAVRCAVSGTKSYKESLVDILTKKGGAAVQNGAKSTDCSAVLVSNLFAPLDTRISKETAQTFLNELLKKKLFGGVIVFCIQKETHSRIIEFLESEAAGAKI